jgi:NMD protein affecting ribosome stability and mRNA decay
MTFRKGDIVVFRGNKCKITRVTSDYVSITNEETWEVTTMPTFIPSYHKIKLYLPEILKKL